MKKILIAAVLATALFASRPARAQFGIPTIVYDPMNYANDLLRYAVMGATYLLAQAWSRNQSAAAGCRAGSSESSPDRRARAEAGLPEP